MLYLYVFAGLSIILLILQMIKKISLSQPILVYTEIVLFPIWCVYSVYSVFIFFNDMLASHSVIPGENWLDIFGTVSSSSVIDLLLALFLSFFPNLLFLTSYIKVNIFPYKRIRKCLPEEWETATQISCTRLCRYALFMLLVYLSIAIYITIKILEPLILSISMVAYSIPWGIAASLIVLIVIPPLGLLLFLVLAGLTTFVVSMLLSPLVFAVLLLTIALIITLNAVVRTCRFTGHKILWFTILDFFPGINIGILIYLLICLSHKKSNNSLSVD